MKKNLVKKVLSVLFAVALLATVYGCTKTAEESTNLTTNTASVGTTDISFTGTKVEDIIDESDMFTDRELDSSYDSVTATITLKDSGTAVDGENVTVDGDTVTITAEGVYVLSGSLTNGQIIVEAQDTEKVQLVLSGVDINCETSAAIYVKQADKVFITSAKGTSNTLTNSADFVQTDDNNVNAVVYSKDDLVLNGEGTLSVTAKYGHAVSSKDDLKVTGGTYNITSEEKNGLDANDSVRITQASITITAANDAIHADNDEDSAQGYVYIKDGTVVINAEDDAIHASSAVKIADGTVTVESCTEGIEGNVIHLAGGTIDITASDDAVNASSGSSTTDAQQALGTATASTTDDTLTAEATAMGEMPSGEAPSGEAPSGNMQGGMQGGAMMDTDESCYLQISGGTITVDSGGDGLDSNGYMYITGGTTVVYGAENSGNGALDSGISIEVTGGNIIALGMSGMAEGFSDSSTQGAILCNSVSGSEGDTVSVKDASGKVLISVTAVRSFNSVAVSTPDMTSGNTYTITAGSSSADIELSSTVYSDSAVGGMGGMRGGMQGAQREDFSR